MIELQQRTVKAPDPTVDFSGRWKNQRGSMMELIVNGTLVVGTYKTKVGSPDDKDLFFLQGFASNDQISFCVNFGAYGTLTAWVGQYAKEAGKPEMLHTSFVASVNIDESDEPDQIWGGVRTGSDFFRRHP